MSNLFVKPIFGTPQTNPLVAEAMECFKRIREESHLDEDVLVYPSTAMLCAYDKPSGRPKLFVPVQRVLMFDAVAPSADASPMEIAAGLAGIVRTVAYDAYKEGIGEVYFPSTDEGVTALAMRHGFILMDYDSSEQMGEMKMATKKLMPFLKLKVYR